MEKSLSFWRDALGIELHELRDVPAEKSQVAFLPLAGAEVELVMPTTDDSGIAKYLAKRGPGMHHICLEVDDIDGMMSQLKEKNIRSSMKSRAQQWMEKICLHPSRVHGRGVGGTLSDLRMTEKYRSNFENECGLVKDRPIIVGVSGGPDSLCLMETPAAWRRISCHCCVLRSPTSPRYLDARMVEKTASRLMLELCDRWRGCARLCRRT
jgi:methylmalonyl-CoA/ethylmalonyl-CoA epimerase